MIKTFNIAIVSLMGIPASGKSTLCNEIVHQTRGSQNSNNFGVIVLAYDDFIPLEFQALCTSDENSAKLFRSKFLQVIEVVVSNLLESKTFEYFDDEIKSLFNELGIEKVSKLSSLYKNWKNMLGLEKFDQHSFKNILVLIDDNNYYHSMRNELYQIGKKYKTGFCVLYTNATIVDCIERNSCRGDESKLTKNVIEEMSKKIEEPDPLRNLCDALSFQVQDVKDVNSYSLIEGILEYALQHPIDVKTIQDHQEKNESDRRICSDNEIHQADLVLRKWIHTEITIASFSKQKNEIKMFTDELLLRKVTVLRGLKSGKLSIVSTTSTPAEFRKEIEKLAQGVDISNTNPL